MKIYLLKYYYNQYDQLDGYVEGVFKEMPDFHKLKEFYEVAEATRPCSRGHTFDACLGMLSKGEEVYEGGGCGGDSWKIVEEGLY